MVGLSGVLSIAAAGLDSASNQLAVTAQRIANFGTGGTADDSSGTNAGNGTSGDLTQNVVELLGERTLYQANAMVLKTADRMLGTLLDVLDTNRNGRS